MRLTPQLPEAPVRSQPGNPWCPAPEFPFTEGELYSVALQTDTASTLNTEKTLQAAGPLGVASVRPGGTCPGWGWTGNL